MARIISDSRRLKKEEMRGIGGTDRLLSEMKVVAAEQRLSKDGMPAAMGQAEQLRLIRTGISISEPKLQSLSDVTYSADLAAFAK